MEKQKQSVVEYVARYNIAVLDEIRDTILTWHYLKLRDFNRVPRSIITMDYSKQRPLPAYGRPQIGYACYLMAKGEYAKMIGMLEYPRGLFLSDGVWHDRIVLFLLLAIGYHNLGKTEAALSALGTACDMCCRNDLTALFIESGDHLLPLMRLARQRRKSDFSSKWLDSVYGRVRDFARRAEAVCAEYRRRNPVRTIKDNPLSRRERLILQALAQGLTREEIALAQYISVNTVKAAIRSIYTKLNANNRAEAVSIAIVRRYIEGYSAE